MIYLHAENISSISIVHYQKNDYDESYQDMQFYTDIEEK